MERRGFKRKSALILLILALVGGFLLLGAYDPSAAQAAPELIKDMTPDVVSVSPTDQAVEVLLTANVSVTFDRAMIAATINEDSFYLTYSTLLLKAADLITVPGFFIHRVDATVTVADDRKSAKLNPDAPLDPGIKYTAHLTDDIKAMWLIQERTLDDTPYTWNFTTVTRPAISARTPAADATNLPLDQVVNVTFDKAVTGVSPASFYVKETLSGTQLSGGVAYNSTTHMAVLDPSYQLKPNTNYTVTITSAVKGVGDVSLKDPPVTWKFTTGAGNPVVTATTPADGATDVPVDQVVSASFSTAMDASTIDAGSFTIKKSGGSPLAATVGYSGSAQKATLTPSAALEFDTTYLVTLSAAIKGATGDALDDAPVVWSFTTAEEEQEPEPSTFTDVPANHPYAIAIGELADRLIILGPGDGTFLPNDPVTRQQFAKMIVKSLKLIVTGSEVCPFTDVVAQAGIDPFYPSKYVAVCATEEITKGYANGTFGAKDPIKHQQLITMVTRAAGVTDPGPGFVPTFTAGQFSLQEHYVNARTAAYAGLLDDLVGIGPAYDFLAASTRGECAQILYNLIMLIES